MLFRSESNIVEKGVAESSSKKKTYQYIPSSQRKKGDPIFRVIDKSRDMKGITFPTPLPPLVQYRIQQSQKDPRGSSANENKNKNITHISAFNRDDESLPISLYDNKVLYMMQQMGYDVATGPSLCDGRGQLAPFEKVLSQEQLEALHEDQVLKEKKHGLGYEVCMASAEYMDMTDASPQMEDVNQCTVDDLEEINIGTTDDPRPIFISKHLSEGNKQKYQDRKSVV